MKIGITGATGKVGQRLLKMGAIPLDCDVTDLSSVERAIDQVKPDVICHLAALGDVDWCERPENKEQVIKVNLRGTFHVSNAARERKITVVLLSTDHVFDGKHGPYRETDHPKNPVNFYGMSKMAAEALREVFPNLKIVRTSYLFNWERLIQEFPIKMEYSRPVPTFLHRSFMYEGHFAQSLFTYLLRFDMMPPILHISGSQTISWYDFALAVASVWGVSKASIIPRKKEWKIGPNDAASAPRPKKAGLQTKLSAKFLKQYSCIEGLMEIKGEQE